MEVQLKLSEIATVTSGPLLSRYSKEKNQAKPAVGKIDVITPRCIGNGYVTSMRLDMTRQ